MQTEPSVDDLYAAYKHRPSQDNLSAVVKALGPTVNYALGAVGAQGDPLVKSKALVYAAQAVQKYDPVHGASLPTYVSSNLRQLSRTARQSKSIVKMPERIQLDAYHLSESAKKFQDLHGREPDSLELADLSGMPLRRIEKVRKYARSLPSEASMPEGAEQNATDFTQEAMDYAYHDADHLDRRILEMKTGYAGHPILSAPEIGAKLGLTPSQLSRRSAKLTYRINELQNALESV